VPVVGDIIHLPNPKMMEATDITGVTLRYRVVSRELMWSFHRDDKRAPAPYSKNSRPPNH
jgi:hypothetical protein